MRLIRGANLRSYRIVSGLHKFMIKHLFRGSGFVVKGFLERGRYSLLPISRKPGFMTSLVCDNPENMVWIFENYLDHNSVFIDVGAHVGEYSFYASLICRNGMIFAFEPDPESFISLKENVSFNKISNIVVENLAVTDSKSIIQFYTDTNNSAYSSISASNVKSSSYTTVEVKTTSLDEYFLSLERVKRVDFIKIDVEGSEILALRGMVNLIEKFHPKILIEVYGYALENAGSSVAEVISFLGGFGHTPYCINSRTGEQTESDWKTLMDLASSRKPVKDVNPDKTLPDYSNLLLIPRLR